MTGTIQIGDKSITFCGNAATPIRYKQVFRQDLLMSFKGMSPDGLDTDLILQLAFIMAEQAEGTDFNSVTFDAYVDWLEQFEENDILQAMPDIVNLWMNNSKASVKAKKK